jgi:hypothetical protein
MYPAIGYDDLVDIWVPRVPTVVCDRVREAVAEGLGFQEEFFGLIREQAAMLEEFLRPIGAPPSPLTGDTNKANWTEVRRSESLLEGTAERVDAEFFRREYAEFDERLKRAMPTFLLGEHFSLSPGRGLGNGEEIVPLIKQGILTNAGVNWSAISHEEGKCIHSDGCVTAGDILLACTAHEIYYVGRKVDFVREVPPDLKFNEAVADVMVLKPKASKPTELYGSYVAAFLRSPSGLHQVQRCIRGLRGGHVYKEDLSRYVRVPVPSAEWLGDFEQRAEKYEHVRQLANTSMKLAIGEVETWLAAV